MLHPGIKGERVYVCKKCNKEGEKPKTGWRRKYCPTGHHLLGDAVVRPFWRSFTTSFGLTLFLFYSALSVLLVTHDSAPREYVQTVHFIIGFMLAIPCFKALLSFKESKAWSKRGGAVEKLIPSARGKGFGCISAAGLLFLGLLPALL